MESVTPTNESSFDRRQIYRPFLEKLNPIALTSSVVQRDLIEPPKCDPRDPRQPPIYEAFANAAELSRGTQMALVGGIGSGKTTELLLTDNLLKRHQDAVNIFLDASEFTDFANTNPGAMLAAIGLRLFAHAKKLFGEASEDVGAALDTLRELAHGKTEWHEQDPADHYDDADDFSGLVPVNFPGLMTPRFPNLKKQVSNVKELLDTMLVPFLEHDSQITVIVDGLDRLIEPVRFREFAEQDLRALRGTTITMIVAVPLLLWYDKSQFLQDYFDIVKHIPAAVTDPKESDFLKSILKRRGASELMTPALINETCRFSGGVLRDLLMLAQTSAQYAYREAQDRIAKRHVRAAIRQLGNQYQIGLGSAQRRLIQLLRKQKQFSPYSSASRELLVNRQVLEYSRAGRDYFLVHPALAEVLPEKP